MGRSAPSPTPRLTSHVPAASQERPRAAHPDPAPAASIPRPIPAMPRPLLLLRPALVAAVLLAPALRAHDGIEVMLQRQARTAAPLVFESGGTPEGPFESDGVSLLSWLPLSSFAGVQTSGADSWGYTSPSGREYAILCMSDGIAFVEVTDPGQPQILTTIGAVGSLWRDVKVFEDHAYYVSEGGGGVQIVDLSQIDAGIVSNVGSVNAAGTTATHNVAIDVDSGFLYQCGGGGDPVEGLRIYSLANKANPGFVGEWDDRYVHDAQVVTYTSGPFAGKQVAFCFSETGSGGGSPAVDILDVTNKGNIQSIAQVSYSNPVFSHQGWLSPDRQHLYMNDELDESTFGTLTTTRVIDVSDLTSPFQVGTFTSGSTSIDHNLYTKGDLIYEANYRSGLRVFDASDPTAPVQTAWFDTYGADDGVAFNGLWNAYPYFDSGTIIGSDMEKGLFAWRLGEPDLDIDLPAIPELVAADGDVLDVTITPQNGAMLDASSPTIHLDTGAGFVSQPLSDLGGGTWRAFLPAVACGTPITFYFTARTTDGVTWHEPEGAPACLFGATAASSVTTVFSVDFESAAGWSVGAPGDDATTGIWTRVNPIGTEAQPEDDHTAAPGATDCYVTGQGSPGGSVGENDVDSGKTTLLSSVFDLSDGDATVRYWRWYHNQAGASPGADTFVVDVSNDGGASWTNVEVVGPSGGETAGGWFQHAFLVGDLVAPTAQMRVRFVASDEGDGSIVEAAVDDFEVVRFACTPDDVCQTDIGFGGPGDAVFSICGEPLDTGNTATLALEQAAPSSLAVLFLSLAENPTPFKGGTLVTIPFAVSVSLVTDPTGAIALPVPGGGGPATLYGQLAISDPSQPNGVAISNALEIVFGP